VKFFAIGLSTPDVVGFVAVTRAPLTGAHRLTALSVHQLRTTPYPTPLSLSVSGKERACWLLQME
jgi:hypothetical protein